MKKSVIILVSIVIIVGALFLYIITPNCIFTKDTKSSCIYRLAVERESTFYCLINTIFAASKKTGLYCYCQIAKAKKDINLCDKCVEFDTLRPTVECYLEVLDPADYASICPRIESLENREDSNDYCSKRIVAALDYEKVVSENSNTDEQNSNAVVPNTIKEGDIIAGMTVVSAGPFNDQAPFPIESNIKVDFSGRTTITGAYYYEDTAAPGIICFDSLDDNSEKKMPEIKGSERKTWFCFKNQEFAKKEFGPKGSSGAATIIIDKYQLVSYPAGVFPSAELVEVIDKKI